MTYKFNTAEYPALTSVDEKKYIFICKSSDSKTEKQEAIDKLVYLDTPTTLVVGVSKNHKILFISFLQ